MIKRLIFSSLIFFSLQGWAQSDKELFKTYMDKGSAILNKLRNNDSKDFEAAVNAFNTAMLIYPDSADHARDSILEVFKVIDMVKEDALTQRKKADSNFRRAEKATKEANDLTEEAARQREKFKAYNLANAPYRYLRLIRDIPKDEAKIQKNSFEVKLVAYSDHLDTLKILLSDTSNKLLDSIPGARSDYDKLQENLYYNNELYEKIFYSLRARGAEREVFKPAPKKPDTNYFKIQYFGDSTTGFSLSKDSSKIQVTRSNSEISPSQPNGKKYTSFNLSQNSNLIFCGTEDHYVMVYKWDNSGNIILQDKIPMGTKVTGLKFDDKHNIIFFGTIKGDLGFIEYSGNKKKHQPVYDIENALVGSKITAIDVVEINNQPFLLSASHAGKAAVYKLDTSLLNVPGNKFLGNYLPDPDNVIGNIVHGAFDQTNKQVIFEISKNAETITKYIFLWDPFTKSALCKLKKVIGPLLPKTMEDTNYYK